MTLVASARVAVKASEDGGLPAAVGDPPGGHGLLAQRKQARARGAGQIRAASSSERSVLAPEYAGASTITGALEA